MTGTAPALIVNDPLTLGLIGLGLVGLTILVLGFANRRGR